MWRIISTLVLFLQAAACAQTVPAPSADIASLLPALASEDFSARQSARRQLSKLGHDQRDALARLAASAKDPEVRAVLVARLDELDADRALHPPGISVHLENASAQDLCMALGVASGARFNASNLHHSVTVQAEKAPFHDILAQLQKQGMNNFSRQGPYLTMEFTEARGEWTFAPLSIHTSNAYKISPTEYNISYDLFRDPRVSIVDVETAYVDARDDQGRPLHIRYIDSTWCMNPSTVATCYATIDFGKHPPRPIASVKGTVTLTVPLATTSKVLDDPAAILNQPVSLGSAGTFTLKSWKMTRSSVAYEAEISHTREQAHLAVKLGHGAGLSDYLISAMILDADGRPIEAMATNGDGGFSSGDKPLAYPQPYKIILSRPTKVATLAIPLELKNIRLPPVANP